MSGTVQEFSEGFNSSAMPKILLVEDDCDAAVEVKALLTANRMTLEVVPTVDRARDFVSVSDYDLIILDWNLPDGTGVDFLKFLRDKGCQSPVLMLTGRVNIDDKLTGFTAGADDYLGKPFHAVELLCRVQALLRRPHGRLENILKAGNLVLDIESRRVTRDGEDLHLMPKEFAVLEFFMRNPNRVFSPEALLERVWETDNESTSHTVVATIHRLRKKIDSPGIDSKIKNQFGMGYSFTLDESAS